MTGQNQSGIHISAQARCELSRFDSSGSCIIIRSGLKHSNRSVKISQQTECKHNRNCMKPHLLKYNTMDAFYIIYRGPSANIPERIKLNDGLK